MFDRVQLRVRCNRGLIFGGLLLTLLLCIWGRPEPDSFRFAILGDRTGEVQQGVYEQVWKEVAAEGPAFVVSVGDTIQGMNDRKRGSGVAPQPIGLSSFIRRYPLYLAPGNHDIWSPRIGAAVPAVRRAPPTLQFRLRTGAFHHPGQ
jgi:hypothetical protein